MFICWDRVEFSDIFGTNSIVGVLDFQTNGLVSFKIYMVWDQS